MSGEIDLTKGFLFTESGDTVSLTKLNNLVNSLSAEIQAGAVTERELADGSITADKVAADLQAQLALQDGAVSTAKLEDGAVTNVKLSEDTRKQTYIYAVDNGSANAYVISPPVSFSSYSAGMTVRVLINNDNTGASTINVSSLGTKAIQKNGAALTGGELEAGGVYDLTYDGTQFQIVNYAFDLLDEDDFTSDSAVAAPTQQSTKAYVDSGDKRVLLGSSEIGSSTAALSYTGLGADSYYKYEIEVDHLSPVTSTAELCIRFSTDNGSTYISSSSYQYAIQYASVAATPSWNSVGSTSATEIHLAVSQHNSASDGYSGVIEILNPQAAFNTRLLCRGFYLHSSVVNYTTEVGGYLTTAGAVNAIQIFMNSGNIQNGFVRVYGIKGS